MRFLRVSFAISWFSPVENLSLKVWIEAFLGSFFLFGVSRCATPVSPLQGGCITPVTYQTYSDGTY